MAVAKFCCQAMCFVFLEEKSIKNNKAGNGQKNKNEAQFRALAETFQGNNNIPA